jgi:hypothetical protein
VTKEQTKNLQTLLKVYGEKGKRLVSTRRTERQECARGKSGSPSNSRHSHKRQRQRRGAHARRRISGLGRKRAPREASFPVTSEKLG